MKALIIVLPLLFSVSIVMGQSVRGTVKDSQTGEPIEYANVYLANTDIGTVTNAKGKFLIKDFAKGKYNLTVSFVGYKIYSEPIDLNETELVQLQVNLEPDFRVFPEVLVLADTSNWEKYYKLFRDKFIGTAPSSKKTEIINKRKMAFYYDKKDAVLYAHAREPLVIVNNWLGYEIIYDMISFQYDSSLRKINYLGIPRFRNLEAKNEIISRRWQRNREKSYYGSLRHFFRSIRLHNLEENEFSVFELYKVPNKDRMPEELLNEKIAYFRNKLTASSRSRKRAINDSLSYYLSEQRKLIHEDSIGRTKYSREVMSGDVINYDGILKVVYKGAKESVYYPFKSYPNKYSQHSKLHILDDLKLYDNGYYEPIESVYVEGYWSWSGTMSSLLPMNYTPQKSKR